MKVGRLDKDGLDLLFTIGNTHDLNDIKGDNIQQKFERSMAQACREIEQRDHTDMADTLRKRFDAYINIKKKQTLIILTDGLWEGGAASKDDVEDAVKEFVLNLTKKRKKMEKRWFTIQFISFGDDPAALERLEKLDDKLDAV